MEYELNPRNLTIAIALVIILVALLTMVVTLPFYYATDNQVVAERCEYIQGTCLAVVLLCGTVAYAAYVF